MGIAQSTYYHEPKGTADDTALVEAMHAIKDEFEAYGWRRMQAALRLSNISAYGTGWGIFIREDFWLIAVTEGNEDETECSRAKVAMNQRRCRCESPEKKAWNRGRNRSKKARAAEAAWLSQHLVRRKVGARVHHPPRRKRNGRGQVVGDRIGRVRLIEPGEGGDPVAI